MESLTLTTKERERARKLVRSITSEFDDIESHGVLEKAAARAGELPPRVVEFLERFRIEEPSAVCLVSGWEVSDEQIGPTPAHWRGSNRQSASLEEEVFFLLLASRLGDPFAWSTQQDGRIMHDVLPIRGHEYEELGSNSLQTLSWHTEDAFHPCRGDYVSLMCLRNPTQVATTVCDGSSLPWQELDVETLFQPLFTQMPDNSHLPDGAAPSTGDPEVDRLRQRSFDLIKSRNADPEPVPLLFGDRQDPYLCLDPYYMDPTQWGDDAREAFTGLCQALDEHLTPVALKPGDCVFVDNYRAVHGRVAFRARYDGTDRWLKRLNITRNLRGSRAWRRRPASRVIY